MVTTLITMVIRFLYVIVFAEITLSTEEIALIAGLLGTVAGATAWGVKGWLASLAADRDTWKSIALENIDDLELVANRVRKSKGKPSIRTLVAVVPESSSPPTEQQVETADIATVRARQALLRKDLDLPAQREVRSSLVAEIKESMKAKVDEVAKQVDASVEDIKDKIEDIK